MNKYYLQVTITFILLFSNAICSSHLVRELPSSMRSDAELVRVRQSLIAQGRELKDLESRSLGLLSREARLRAEIAAIDKSIERHDRAIEASRQHQRELKAAIKRWDSKIVRQREIIKAQQSVLKRLRADLVRIDEEIKQINRQLAGDTGRTVAAIVRLEDQRQQAITQYDRILRLRVCQGDEDFSSDDD